MKFNPEDYYDEPVKSSCRFTRLENPNWRARLILRHGRKHLMETEWRRTPESHITDAILCIEWCSAS